MLDALIGGSIIGVAVSLMLVCNGRVAGICGIMAGVLIPMKEDLLWRVLFVLGLISGGFVLKYFKPEAFALSVNVRLSDYAIAGLLVGFGTLLGSGCTSGHGVCGISRFSKRSFLSTITFISFGILSLLLFKLIRGEV